MEKPDSDAVQSGQSTGDDLFSLAFDCTSMVTKLGQGFEKERAGDHESAISYLESVDGQIDEWIEKLAELDTGVVDKEELLRGLLEAKEAIDPDTLE